MKVLKRRKSLSLFRPPDSEAFDCWMTFMYLIIMSLNLKMRNFWHDKGGSYLRWYTLHRFYHIIYALSLSFATDFYLHVVLDIYFLCIFSFYIHIRPPPSLSLVLCLRWWPVHVTKFDRRKEIKKENIHIWK